MKKLLCFLLLPIIFVGMNICYIKDIYTLAGYALFIGINFLFSCMLYFIVSQISKNANGLLFNTLGIALLGAVIDQLIKIIVYSCNLNFKVIGNLFRIEQTKNINQVAALNYLNIEFNHFIILIFKIAIVIVIIWAIIYIKNKNKYVTYSLILLLAASVAHLMDSVFWGYTLDCFYFNKLTCYDLKDFYVDAAIGIILMNVIYKNGKQEVKE